MALPKSPKSPRPVVGVVPGHGSTIGGFEEFVAKREQEREDEEEQPKDKQRRKLVDHSMDTFLQEVFGDQVPPPPPDPLDPRTAMPSMAFLKAQFKTKSAIIRYLHSKGFKVNDIAKHMNTRYQHVRNVLTNELKRGPNENFSLTDPED